ncbi:uncharacterized protein K441DRAFT_233251 [Cenococcum geophilum 1.58]|uniref:uncharacterized protein n=1 Tax=Cenococcum geophilum 1.58 TaxID=794803 RepID=UPI00358E2C60|nr:hypothetical protein K441DRAFT_233251 [Cenococcum geophilum 1.58]
MQQWILSLCSCLSRPRPKGNDHNHLHRTIDIYTNLDTDPLSSRLATLSLNADSDLNLISKKLVNEVLSIETRPHDKGVVSVDGQQVRLQGYVDIRWSINSAPRKIYSTRFYVPEIDDPSFDVRLAKQTIQEYGLLKSKSTRYW